MDLYLDIQSQTVYATRTGSGGPLTLDLNQGDNMRVRLWLMQPTDGPQLKEVVTLPEPYTLINMSGKAKSALSAATPLFTVGDFEAVSVIFNEGEETEYTEVHYEADLNLNTTEIAAILDPSGEGATPVDEFDFFWSISFTNGATGDDWRGWTPLPRGEGTMLRDIYLDDTAPTDADPPYPDADQIAPISGGNYQFVLRAGSYVLELKNTTTGAFHKVSIIGASGEEQLVIDAAS